MTYKCKNGMFFHEAFETKTEVTAACQAADGQFAALAAEDYCVNSEKEVRILPNQ